MRMVWLTLLCLLGVATTAAIIGILTGTGVAGAFYAKAVAVGSTYVAVFLLRRILVFADPSGPCYACCATRRTGSPASA